MVRSPLILDPLALPGMLGITAAGAALLLIASRPWRSPRPVAAARWPLVAGLTFLAACRVLVGRPALSLAEAQDRLLALIVPAAVAVEVAASFPLVPRPLVWMLRLIVAAGTAPILLQGSIYLADAAGPGTRQWSLAEVGLWLGALGSALAVAWSLLVLLASVAPARSVLLGLVVACAGLAVALQESGSSTSALVALVLAAVLTGTALGSLCLPRSRDMAGSLGVGVVGLFGLLVDGRFFGQLAAGPAALLLAAPLLGFLPELPPVRRLALWLRGGLRLALVAVVVAAALTWARQPPERPASREQPGEPSEQDYWDFRPR